MINFKDNSPKKILETNSDMNKNSIGDTNKLYSKSKCSYEWLCCNVTDPLLKCINCNCEYPKKASFMNLVRTGTGKINAYTCIGKTFPTLSVVHA